MADLPVSSAVASATAQAAPQVAAIAMPTPVEASVASLPDKIQQLARQIQVNATVTQLPGDGSISLTTNLGPLTLQLPALAAADQAKLLQQLAALVQNQRSLTILLQPGNPPTQAFLFLPSAPAAAATSAVLQAAPNPVLTALINQPRLGVTPGMTLPAIILAPNATQNGPTPSAQQPLPVYMPPSAVSASAPGLTSALAPVTATLAELADNAPLELINNPAFQELAAQAEITTNSLSTPAAPPTTLPALEMGLSNPSTTTAATASPANMQSVSQPASPAQTAAFSPALSMLTPNIPTAAPTPATLLQAAGTEVQIQVNTIIPPPAAGALSSALPTPGPNQILATVAGTGPGGQILLQAGDVALYIKQPVDLPVGSNLLLTIEQFKTQTLQTLATPGAENIANLQSALSTLAQINPQVAQQVLVNHIPQATDALPGALLFFLSALKQSNVRGWLGDDAVDTLSRAGKFELLSKLTEDLTRSGQTASDPVVGEWQSYPIPLQTNNQFQIINFYVHGDGRGNQDGPEAINSARKHHTRFIIDVRMSQLGPMQLDGFVQQQKLDIMVRSEHVLPEGLHKELRDVYINALGGIGYAGSLNFQVGRHHWLIIQNAKAHGAVVT